jgi:hypothetical protein
MMHWNAGPLIVALVLLGVGPAAAQQSRGVRVDDSGGRRLALVIGNQAYPRVPLKNPRADANAMAQALQKFGFHVDLSLDADLKGLNQSVDRFMASLRPGDVALVYYSGHGMQIDNENYLLPVDFVLKDEADAKYESYSANRIVDRVSASGARLNILVLDACRDNPFRSSRSAARGLAAMETGRGTLVAFATAPNQTADDNPAGPNGLFTTYVLDAMNEPGVGIEQVFFHARQKVFGASNGRQVPWLVSSIIGDFYFSGPATTTTDTAPPHIEPRSVNGPRVTTYFIKGQGSAVYVPFVLSVETALESKVVGVYCRLAPATGARPVKFPWEDYRQYDLTNAPSRDSIQWALSAPPGDYILSLAVAPVEVNQKAVDTVRELLGLVDRGDPRVVTQRLSIPNFIDGKFATSSVMLLRDVKALARPIAADAQVAHPFAFGALELDPATPPRFSRTGELSVIFFTYNPSESQASAKPDVAVTFSVYSRTPGNSEEQFFNRIAPQILNAQTLPADFDLRAGHQLQVGQAISLRTLEPGDYRLEILITDRANGAQLTRNALFTVY